MIRRLVIIVVMILISDTIINCQISDRKTIYLFVAANGNDAWTGNLPNPNSSNTDGPLKTLQKAKDIISGYIDKNDNSIAEVDVEMRKGIYFLNSTLYFDSTDCSKANLNIVYKNYKDEEVILCGGIQLPKFQSVTDEEVLGKLSNGANQNIKYVNLHNIGIKDLGTVASEGNWMELYYNDQPMILARWPNTGFCKFEIADVKGSESDKNQNQITYAAISYAGTHINKWLSEDNIWLHGYWYWNWSDSYEEVSSIDTKDKQLILAAPYSHYGYKNGQRFYAENILSELDTAGEWYLDRKNYNLYFWPPPNPNGTAYIPQLKSLIEMQNVSNIKFEGITFEITKGDAITINRGNDISFDNCIVRNTGGYGIVEKDVENSKIMCCKIYYNGDGGVEIEGGDRKQLNPGNNEISFCKIHDYALLNRTYQPGIKLEGVGNTIQHNEIYNTPGNAILFYGNDHHISYNYIHNVCYETADVGAIYSDRDWTMRGTKIEFNLFTDIKPKYNYLDSTRISAVYLDDGISGTTVNNNIFYNLENAIHINGGRDNNVERNIFLSNLSSINISRSVSKNSYSEALLPRLNSMPYKGSKWAEKYPRLVNILGRKPMLAAGNVVENNICYRSEWINAKGIPDSLIKINNNMINTNPGFIDVGEDNFKLDADSRAKNIGFNQDIISSIGVRGKGCTNPK
jgi:Right handed beta helix region